MLGIGALLVALAIPAACGGSTLSPEEVKAANDKVNGTINGGGTGTDGTVTPGDTSGLTPGDTTGNGSTGNGSTGNGSTGNGSTGNGSTGNGSTGNGSTGNGPKAGGGIKAGDCSGMANGKGISASSIKIGNSSDLTGPVPALFEATQQATKAYVNYFNKTRPDGICGRKLELTNLDSRTDAGADQAAYTKLCDEVFAAVGSMSAFDSGGAATAEKCGLPDIRTAVVTGARNDCNTCFGTQPTGKNGEFQSSVYKYWLKKDKAATQKAAFLYLNAGAAAENAKIQRAAGAKLGMNWVYTSAIDVADFNYGPYVQAMKDKGVQFVQFLGAYQQSAKLATAIKQGGFNPKYRFYDPSIYEPGFIQQAGDAANGVVFFINFLPLDSNQAELNLYKSWLQQTVPGAKPTFFGLFAWSSAKLFVEKSIELGGKLNRSSLVTAIKNTHSWVGGGMHPAVNVGGKLPPECVRMMTVQNGKFVPYGSTKFYCDGYTKG